jgi:hypothetical protein
MAQKQCGKCGEMVDEAKAFCPGCGESFVEEESREETNFEKMGSTVQLGQTMYNQMLSDMGLSVEKKESPPEKRLEIIEPVKQPASPKTAAVATAGFNRTKWIILAGVILLGLFILLLAAAVLFYYFWPRIN